MQDEETKNEAGVAQEEGAVGVTVEETGEAHPTQTVEELQIEMVKLQERSAAFEQQVKDRDRKITTLTGQASNSQGIAAAIAELQKGQAALAKAMLADEGEEAKPPTRREVYEAELKAGGNGQTQQAGSTVTTTDPRVAAVFEVYELDEVNPPEELSSLINDAALQWGAGQADTAIATLKTGFKAYKAAQETKASEATKQKTEERQTKAKQLVTAGGASQGAAGGYLSDEAFEKAMGDPGGKGLPMTPENVKRLMEIQAKASAGG